MSICFSCWTKAVLRAICSSQFLAGVRPGVGARAVRDARVPLSRDVLEATLQLRDYAYNARVRMQRARRK